MIRPRGVTHISEGRKLALTPHLIQGPTELGINSLSSSGEQNAWGGGGGPRVSALQLPTRPLTAEDGGARESVPLPGWV